MRAPFKRQGRLRLRRPSPAFRTFTFTDFQLGGGVQFSNDPPVDAAKMQYAFASIQAARAQMQRYLL